jgi:hypothetical protein
VTNLEVGSGPEAFDSKNRQVHERAQNKGAYKLRVRYLKVEGRWAGQIQLPLKVGDLLTPESLSKAMNALEAAITRDSVQGYNLRTKGEVGVLYMHTVSGPMFGSRGNAFFRLAFQNLF